MPEETEQEKRLRLEEEARLLAAQEAFAAQQQIQVPDAMAAPELAPSTPVMPPEAQWATPVNTFTGPDLEALRRANPSAAAQYDAQVGAAQRNNGFINAEVTAEGRVLSPMISPELSPQAAAMAEMRARQFSGQQKYRKLLEGGATPEEAMRLAGPDLFYNDSKGLLASIKGSTPRPLRSSLNPEVTNVDGVKMYRTGPNSFAQARPEIPAKPPPETVAGQKILTGQITDARNVLERAEKAVAEDRSDVNAVNAALRARSKLRGLEENFMRGSTNWMERPTPAKQVAAPVKADEQVVVVKDGRRYSLPKSQLEEALKQGYKVQP